MNDSVATASALLSSAILDAPAPDTTPAWGWSRLGELRQSPDFMDRAAKGDQDALNELAKVQKAIMNGVSVIPGAGVNAGTDAAVAAIERDKLAKEVVIDGLRRVADIPDAVADMIRNNTPVSREEKQRAAQEWDRLRSDVDWQRRYLSGDRDCRTQARLLDIIRAAPFAP
jgi:hypothetical protein